jgi:putative heme-binding domain-containing protein
MTNPPSAKPAVRLAAVVALGRQKSPEVAVFLKDTDAKVVREAAHAIHDDFSIPEAMPALAVALNESPVTTEAFVRRAVNANFRLGRAVDAKRLATYAADPGKPAAMRHAALDALLGWPTPNRLDRVTGRDRPNLVPRSAEPVKAAVGAAVDKLVRDIDGGIKQRALALVEQHKITLPAAVIEQLAADRKAPTGVRIQAVSSLREQNPTAFRNLRDALLKDPDARVRAAMLPLVAASGADDAASLLVSALKRDKATVSEQQAALAGLATLKKPTADAEILAWTDRLTNDKVANELKLDVEVAAAARTDNPQIAASLKKYRAGLKPDYRSQYGTTLAGGDVDRGRDLFMNHLAAACIRCHRVAKGPGSTIGPNLMTIGKQKPQYLLESLVDPGAVVAKGFGMVTVTLKDGKSVSGTLARNNKQVFGVKMPDGSIKEIPRDQVASATKPISTMPPMGGILNKSEIRDVIAYLRTLR